MNRRNYNFYEQKGNRRRYSNFDAHCKENTTEEIRSIKKLFKDLKQFLLFVFKFHDQKGCRKEVSKSFLIFKFADHALWFVVKVMLLLALLSIFGIADMLPNGLLK